MRTPTRPPAKLHGTTRGLPVPEGRARLRGRHGRAHQRGHRGPGRLPAGRQAHRLRHDGDAAAQRAVRHDRRGAAVGRLVRLQRRLEPRSERLRGAWCSPTRCSPLPPRRSPGSFAEWIFRARPRCSAQPRARSPVSSRSRRPAAGSARWARSPSARIAGLVCLWAVTGLKKMLGYDDSLDVFGVHCIGGILGALLTGVFNNPALGGTGVYDYVADTVAGYRGTLGAGDLAAAGAWADADLVGRVALICVQDRRPGHRPACDRRAGTRRPRHRVARRARPTTACIRDRAAGFPRPGGAFSANQGLPR